MGMIVKIPIADWLLYLSQSYINNGFGLITKIIVNKEKYPKMDADDPKCSLCLDFFTPPVRITSCGQGFSKTVFMMGA